LAVCVVVVIAVIESILVGAVVILIRNIWGYAYSNEEKVVKYVANMMPLLAVTALLDGMTAVLSGFSLSSITIDLWSLYGLKCMLQKCY
jgi:multidrug resistance protein, MATE family